MKKSFFTVLVLAILSIPFMLFGIFNIMRVKPEVYQPISEFPIAEVTPNESANSSIPVTQPKPSATFLSGYRDGWNGKWLGPIRWTISDDYRQGHMLGSYDKKNGNERYSLKR